MFKKICKITSIVVLFVSVALLINFIPTWNPETSNMHLLEGQWVNVYYESEEAAALDVFQYADAETAYVAQSLGFIEKPNVNVYIYDYQNTMQTKKYGYIGPALGLDWYIGDNIGTNVILTSPANPGAMHDYDNNKYAVLHEIVHAYVSVLNSDIDLWLTEGMANYLANGAPFYREMLDQYTIPSYSVTKTINPIRFANSNGYDFAHTYIEYLHKTYGWDQVLLLIQTEDYNACFGKSQKEIYDEWILYIENYPQ